MRSELEARLMFAAPSELLVAAPASAATLRLLGAYASGARGLRSESVPRERYGAGGAVAAVTSFYSRPGGGAPCMCLFPMYKLLCTGAASSSSHHRCGSRRQACFSPASHKGMHPSPSAGLAESCVCSGRSLRENWRR